MPSIRGAYPIKSITELDKNNCDKYQLILIELNEKLKNWKKEEELFKKSISLFTKTPKKEVYNKLPLFNAARKNYYESQGKQVPKDIDNYEFYNIWKLETENIANDIYTISLLVDCKSQDLSSERLETLANASFCCKQPKWLEDELEETKKNAKQKLKRIREKEALVKAKEKLQTMENELPLIIKSFKDVGLDSLKCEELQDKLRQINSSFEEKTK